MSLVQQPFEAFAGAFDSILNVEIHFRENRISGLQAGVILVLPQLAAFLLTYNEVFGIELKVDIDKYPLLIFVFLVGGIYVVLDPRLKPKSSRDVFRLSVLSSHLFGFALALNLVYAVIVQLFGAEDDPLRALIASAATELERLPQTVFAFIYGLPFLALALCHVFVNSYRRHPWRMQILVKSFFFWRATLLVVILSIYQYMAFILIGTVARFGT